MSKYALLNAKLSLFANPEKTIVICADMHAQKSLFSLGNTDVIRYNPATDTFYSSFFKTEFISIDFWIQTIVNYTKFAKSTKQGAIFSIPTIEDQIKSILNP